MKNRIKCDKCKDIIESEHVHDFKYCGCGAVFVDGGQEYQRLGGDAEVIILLDEEGNETGSLADRLYEDSSLRKPHNN